MLRTLDRRLVIVSLTVALAALTVAASADVLVLWDGSKITTSGSYSVDENKVTFTDAQGRYASLPLDEVDLEASRAATEEAQRPATSKARVASPIERKSKKEAREPVMTITNADVGTAAEGSDSDVAAEPQVILYTTTWCGYCRKARTLLDELEVDYVEHDIEKDPKAYSDKTRKSPSCGVPVTDIAGTVVCGFNEMRLRKLIDGLPAAKTDSAT
ncbi:MAG: glutaredoxin family protein [Acidobacteriota bacterium]